MIVLFRSRLFRIAMLSFAVLFSQTANAAKPARLVSEQTPSAVKLCAAWPESRNDFKGTIKKAQRLNPVPAARTWFSSVVLLPAGATSLRASQRATASYRLQRLVYTAPQFRAYVLRI